MKRLGLVVLVALAACGDAAAGSSVPPGTLDPTFSDRHGRALTAVGTHDDQAFAVAVQKDGKIVVAGSTNDGTADRFAVVRYLRDGSLDTSFGSGGKVTTPVGSGDAAAHAVAIQKDGKIVVAGYGIVGGHSEFGVVRYFPSGVPDPSFNGNGVEVTALGATADSAEGVVVQSNGKIVVAGTTNQGGVHKFGVVRYTKSGVLDSTFNGTGKVITALGTDAFGRAVTLQGNSIVVAGSANSGSNWDFGVARYTSTGTLDPSFAVGGSRLVQIGSGDDYGWGVAAVKGGLLLAGGTMVGANEQFAVAMLTGPGVLGGGFGTNGIVKTPISGHLDEARAVAVQHDGRIVVAGSAGTAGSLNFAAVRYSKTGALDPAFGTGGIVESAFGAGDDSGHGLALLKSGIVVAGTAAAGTKTDVGVAEYAADGTYGAFTDRSGIVNYGVGGADSQLWAAAVQPDGKIVGVGDWDNGGDRDMIVTRLNPDGTIDGTFGFFGFAGVGFGTGTDQAYAVALQPDGKIVVAGYAVSGGFDVMAVARLLPNGLLDTSFNGTGRATTLVGSDGSVAFGVTVQPDGKIVLAGYELVGANSMLALVRYNANGTLDAGFNGTGKVTTMVGTGLGFATTAVIQPDNKILACGQASNGVNNDYALARYNPNGSLDATFGSGGTATPHIASQNADDSCTALALQPDGTFYAAGTLYVNGFGTAGFDLFRLSDGGTPDYHWRPGGVVQVPTGSNTVDGAHGIYVDKKGRVTLGGTGESGGKDTFAIARLTKNALYDSQFGAGGLTTTSFPGSTGDRGRAMVVEPDGSVVVVGESAIGGIHEFAFARYRS